MVNLQTLITNSTYGTVMKYAEAISTSLIYPQLTNSQIITGIVIQEFLFRVPYNQNLDNFTVRFIGILNKYTINMVNYSMKLSQLQNIITLLSNNASKTLTTNTTLKTDITTNNTSNQATAESYNPSSDGNLNMNLSKATSTSGVTSSGVKNGSISNTNFDTTQNQNQTVGKTFTEQDLTIYNTIKYECDNLLQPILDAMNSLFYCFEVGDNNDYWCF